MLPPLGSVLSVKRNNYRTCAVHIFNKLDQIKYPFSLKQTRPRKLKKKGGGGEWKTWKVSSNLMTTYIITNNWAYISSKHHFPQYSENL